MLWSLRGALFAFVLSCTALVAIAQNPPAPKTSDSKTSDSKAPEPKTSDSKKEPAKGKLTLDKIKLPSGSILVITDDMREALTLIPKMVLLTPEQYQDLLDRAANLEKQLRTDKKAAHSCKLTGKLEGEFISLRADFAFSTEQPRTTIVLGLKGSHLLDEGTLDHQPPLLDAGDEGFLVRVEKEGNHTLTLNLRVPVDTKKAGSGERGFELELPGTALTTLNLELPPNVKEIRWNDHLQRLHNGNRWLISELDRAKKLNLTWREPVSLPGSAGPLPSVEGQLDVRLNDSHVLIKADLALEDLRGQAREWQLLLPPQATVEVTRAPTGITHELLPPDGKNPHYVLRVVEPNNERWIVSALVRLPRPAPGARLPIGPFYVEGAYRQQGTITIQASPEAIFGQRLVYHRTGEVIQKDLPKTAPNADLDAVFQYWNLGKKSGPVKAPLELEVRAERGQVKTRTEHNVRVHPTPDGWDVELTTRITAQALLSASDALDLQLPMPRPRATAILGVNPFAAYPTGMPWLALWDTQISGGTRGLLGEFQAHLDDGEALDVTPLDGQGRARIAWPRTLGTKPFIAVLTTKLALPLGQQRCKVEFPRPVGTLEREAKVSVRADGQLELLVGPPGGEEPVPDRHSYLLTAEQSPASIDLSWRRYQPDFPVDSEIDVNLHERTAQVRTQLRFKVPAESDFAGGQIRLHVPEGARNLAVVGGRLNSTGAKPERAWIVPQRPLSEKQELIVMYDFDLPPRREKEQAGARQFDVPLAYPHGATQQSARLRVWASPGTSVALASEDSQWSDRGLEIVRERAELPALVLAATGPTLPLRLRVEEAPATALVALDCERALLRVELNDDRSQLYRARYWVTKIGATALDIELPTGVGECLQGIWLGGKEIRDRKALDWNIVRVPLRPEAFTQPVLLEIAYRLPASFGADKGYWRATLHPPTFRSKVQIAAQRWAVTLPPASVGMVPGSGVTLDYTWAPYSLLLAPRPSVTSEELDAWLSPQDVPEAPGRDVSLAFWRYSQTPVSVYYLPARLWLLVCSVGLLLLAIALLFLPLPRAAFRSIVVALSVATLGLGLLWPAVLPVLVFGCEPGLLILVLIIAGQWLIQERYRRQVVFMAGFSRTSKSSLSRGSGSKRLREPTTVDAPGAEALEPAPASTRQA